MPPGDGGCLVSESLSLPLPSVHGPFPKKKFLNLHARSDKEHVMHVQLVINAVKTAIERGDCVVPYSFNADVNMLNDALTNSWTPSGVTTDINM